MRILFVLGSIYPGASWRRIQHFASYFSRRGHASIIFANIIPYGIKNLKKCARERIKVDGVSVFSILPVIPPGVYHPLITCINVFLLIIISLVFIILSNPEIVVLSVPPGEPALGFFMVCKLYGKRVVFDYRDEWDAYFSSSSLPKYTIYRDTSRLTKVISKFLKKIVTALYIKSDFVSTVTSAFQRSLKQRGVRRIYLVPNGADTTVFHPMDKNMVRAELGLSPDAFVIVYSGLIGGYYALDVAVRALAAFMQRNKLDNVEFVLFGAGRKVKKVLELANSLGVAKNILYLGVKYDIHEIAGIIACADIGLVPYDGNPLWKNTYPAKFFEYCACGIPVVATAYEDSLLTKLIEERRVGLVAQPMSVESLMEVIKKMHLDRAFRKAAGWRARKLVEERFDRDRIAANFLKFLLSLTPKNYFEKADKDNIPNAR